MDKRLFPFINDIRLCILYTLQHAYGNNPRLWESNPRFVLKKFITECLRIEPNDNLIFMTLRFAHKRPTVEKVIDRTHQIYARLFLHLQGRSWRHHPLPSVSIIEHGQTNTLHVHTILNMKKRDIGWLDNALRKAYPKEKDFLDGDCGVRFEFYEKNTRPQNFVRTFDHLYIRPPFDLNGLENYITKEFNWLLIKPKIDFGNFYTSELLFRPIDKTTQKAIPGLHRPPQKAKSVNKKDPEPQITILDL